MKTKTKRTAKKKQLPQTWKTATGEVIKVREMGDMHLLNSHRLLRRQGVLTPFMDQIRALEMEMAKRGLPPLPVYMDAQDEQGFYAKRAKAQIDALSEAMNNDRDWFDGMDWHGQD